MPSPVSWNCLFSGFRHDLHEHSYHFEDIAGHLRVPWRTTAASQFKGGADFLAKNSGGAQPGRESGAFVRWKNAVVVAVVVYRLDSHCRAGNTVSQGIVTHWKTMC